MSFEPLTPDKANALCDKLKATFAALEFRPPPMSRRKIEIHQPCCAEWAAAHQPDTDSECYGPLLIQQDETSYFGGSPCPPADYCPWCGVKKETQ